MRNYSFFQSLMVVCAALLAGCSGKLPGPTLGELQMVIGNLPPEAKLISSGSRMIKGVPGNEAEKRAQRSTN